MELVMNTSGVEPLGACVLIEHYTPELKKSTIIIPESTQDREEMIEQRARVVAIGPFAWHDEPRRAEVGDYVLVSKFSGHKMRGPKDGKSYRLINARDIFAKITHVEEDRHE